MFPSYRNENDQKEKRDKFIQENEIEVENDAYKTERYKTAVWGVDIKKNIVLQQPNLQSNLQQQQQQQQVVLQPEIQAQQAPVTPAAKTQEQAKQTIIQLYTDEPDLVLLRIKPISLTDKILKTSYIGPLGRIYNQNNNKKYSYGESMTDWQQTLIYVYSIRDKKLLDNPNDRKLSISDLTTATTPLEKILNLKLQLPSVVSTVHPINLDGYMLMHIEFDLKFQNTVAIKQVANTGKLISNTKLDKIFDTIDWDKTYEVIQQTVDQYRSDNNYKYLSQKVYDLDLNGKGLSNNRRIKIVGRGIVGGSINPMLLKPYLYLPFGSKYINLTALKKSYLSLRHPGGTMTFNKILLPNDVYAIIKQIVFHDIFDEKLYKNLTNSNKVVLYDIFNYCKLGSKYDIENPHLEFQTNKIELEKLLGELRLGNESQVVKQELFKIANWMHSNKYISDTDFKDLINKT